MKKITLSAISSIAIAALCSCGGGSATEQGAELDSLRALVNEQQAQINDANNFVDVINTSMDSVLFADGNTILKMGEGRVPSREQLKQNLAAYNDLLNKQRERIEQLKKSLVNQKGAQAAKMKEVVEKLQAQIDAKQAEIDELKKEIENKNIDIANLTEHVNSLNKNVEDLTTTTKQQESTISAQDQKLNEAYYLIGSKKQLKALGIMTGGSLFKKSKLDLSAGDASKFTKIDLRQTRTFQIPSGNPTILTQAPAGSYQLVKGKSSSTLTVTDPQKFWSVSNFLVVSY